MGIGYASTANLHTIQADIDRTTNTQQVITYEHHEIHSGSHYFVCNVQDLAINEVLDITLQTPDTTSWAHLTWNIDPETETAWHVYEDAVVTNPLANTLTPVNNNRNHTNTSGLAIKYEVQGDLATANADTNVTTATLLETGIIGTGKTAGNDIRDNEIVLKQNTIYCFRAIANTAGYVDFCFNWYEHTNKYS
jgi:hypothetical protein